MQKRKKKKRTNERDSSGHVTKKKYWHWRNEMRDQIYIKTN